MSFKGTKNLINTKPNTKVFIESPRILRSVNFRVFPLLSLSPASQAQVAFFVVVVVVSPFLVSKRSYHIFCVLNHTFTPNENAMFM